MQRILIIFLIVIFTIATILRAYSANEFGLSKPYVRVSGCIPVDLNKDYDLKPHNFTWATIYSVTNGERKFLLTVENPIIAGKPKQVFVEIEECAYESNLQFREMVGKK